MKLVFAGGAVIGLGLGVCLAGAQMVRTAWAFVSRGQGSFIDGPFEPLPGYDMSVTKRGMF